MKTPVASSGDIVTLNLLGGQALVVHDTLAGSPTIEPLPFRALDPPVMAVDIGPNTSPLYGQESKYVRRIRGSEVCMSRTTS